ncbi:MAG: hypothetical protein BJ554DRAFT_5646, partial [Olpidium bornovanus]
MHNAYYQNGPCPPFPQSPINKSPAAHVDNNQKIPDLQKTTRVLGAVRADDLQARDGPVPRGEALRVLRGDTRGGAVWPAKNDRAVDGPAGH